ncbi:MAG: glycosyltransferase, partial [bacterium]
MNILHILSQEFLTGAETYAVLLGNFFTKQGNLLFYTSDKMHRNIEGKFYPLPIHRNNKSLFGRIKNIIRLIFLIKKEGIEICHTHSRAGSFLAYFACKFCRIPYVTTVHGMLPVHFSSKIFPCFGRIVIAPSKIIKDHLINEFGINEKRIRVIPHPIEVKTQEQEARDKTPLEIAYISRMNGPKADCALLAIESMPKVLSSIPKTRLLIVGDGKRSKEVKEALERINKVMGEVITFIGWQDSITEIIASSEIIIGSGYVGLEALLLEKPLICFGEARLGGLFKEK